jgi:hypothetical protein
MVPDTSVSVKCLTPLFSIVLRVKFSRLRLGIFISRTTASPPVLFQQVLDFVVSYYNRFSQDYGGLLKLPRRLVIII